MKQKAIIVLILLICCVMAYSQNVAKTPEGNYIAVKDTTSRQANANGKTFTDLDGKIYPVFVSKNGKLFVIRISKATGNIYKMYLKP